MKIQLKDVLPGELFWHSEEDFTIGNDEDAGKIIDQTKPMWVWVKREPETFTTIDGKPCTPRITLLCFDGEVRGDILEVFGRPNDNRLFVGVLMEEEEMGIVLSAESEATLRQYLLERAGLVAITLEENKDRIVMRNNHEGFVEEIEDLKSKIAAIRKVLQEPEKGKGRLSEIRHLLREMVPLEELDPFAEKAKSRVVEINWGEDAPEDMFVHVGSKDLPDGSREDIYELYSEEEHGDVETWTRSMVMSMNDHMPGRDKAVIRETVQTPVRTEKEIRMEILKLTLELLSVTSGMSKEEIVDHCLERAKKDEQIRQMDSKTERDVMLHDLMQDHYASIRKDIEELIRSRGYSSTAEEWIQEHRDAKGLKTTLDQTTELIGRNSNSRSWKLFLKWVDATYPQRDLNSKNDF